MTRSRRNPFSRKANSGMPGVDNLGWGAFGHPASSAQPEVDQYGLDSDFAEGVRKGPYLSGPPPASVGWMPDHPAVDQDLVEDYETGSQLHELNLKQAMERKASKCIRLAEKKLGRRASAQEIENLALSYMNLSNSAIQRKLASSFLAEDEMMSEWHDEMMAEDVVQEGTGYYGDVDAEDVFVDESMMLSEMDIMGRKANRNRLAGSDLEQLAEEAVSTAEELAEEIKALKKANASLRSAKKSEESVEVEQLAEEAVSTAEQLAEEVETLSEEVETLAEEIKALKKANAQLRMAKKSEEELSDSEVLEEEIKALKKANARLRSRLAGTEVQDALEHNLAIPGEQPVERKASAKKAGVGRLASVLGDYLAEEDDTGSLADLLAEIEAEEQTQQMASKYASKKAKKAGQNDPRHFYQEEIQARKGKQAEEEEVEEEETTASKKAMFMAEEEEEMMAEEEDMMDEEVDPFGLDVEASEADPRLANLFFASEEEEEVEEEATASKKANRLAKAKKSEEEVEEEESEEEVAEEEEVKPAKKAPAKKASITPRPKTQQASVKTLGNISRTASDANELSKLWESAPDVSKFFS